MMLWGDDRATCNHSLDAPYLYLLILSPFLDLCGQQWMPGEHSADADYLWLAGNDGMERR